MYVNITSGMIINLLQTGQVPDSEGPHSHSHASAAASNPSVPEHGVMPATHDHILSTAGTGPPPAAPDLMAHAQPRRATLCPSAITHDQASGHVHGDASEQPFNHSYPSSLVTADTQPLLPSVSPFYQSHISSDMDSNQENRVNTAASAQKSAPNGAQVRATVEVPLADPRLYSSTPRQGTDANSTSLLPQFYPCVPAENCWNDTVSPQDTMLNDWPWPQVREHKHAIASEAYTSHR